MKFVLFLSLVLVCPFVLAEEKELEAQLAKLAQASEAATSHIQAFVKSETDNLTQLEKENKAPKEFNRILKGMQEMQSIFLNPDSNWELDYANKEKALRILDTLPEFTRERFLNEIQILSRFPGKVGMRANSLLLAKRIPETDFKDFPKLTDSPAYTKNEIPLRTRLNDLTSLSQNATSCPTPEVARMWNAKADKKINYLESEIASIARANGHTLALDRQLKDQEAERQKRFAKFKMEPADEAVLRKVWKLESAVRLAIKEAFPKLGAEKYPVLEGALGLWKMPVKRGKSESEGSDFSLDWMDGSLDYHLGLYYYNGEFFRAVNNLNGQFFRSANNPFIFQDQFKKFSDSEILKELSTNPKYLFTNYYSNMTRDGSDAFGKVTGYFFDSGERVNTSALQTLIRAVGELAKARPELIATMKKVDQEFSKAIGQERTPRYVYDPSEVMENAIKVNAVLEAKRAEMGALKEFKKDLVSCLSGLSDTHNAVYADKLQTQKAIQTHSQSYESQTKSLREKVKARGLE